LTIFFDNIRIPLSIGESHLFESILETWPLISKMDS